MRHAYEDLPSYYLIDSNLYRGNPVIVRLHLASGWTHFVVVMGKQGFDYLIRDPSSAGLRKGVYPLRELGSKIEALRFYERRRTRVNTRVAGGDRPSARRVSAFLAERAQGGVRFGGQPMRLLPGAVQSQDGRIRRLLRGHEVFAGAFAEFLAGLGHVENVVDDLKCQPQRAAEISSGARRRPGWRSRSWRRSGSTW